MRYSTRTKNYHQIEEQVPAFGTTENIEMLLWELTFSTSFN